MSWYPEENALIAGKRGHAISVQTVYDALHKLPEIVEATCSKILDLSKEILHRFLFCRLLKKISRT